MTRHFDIDRAVEEWLEEGPTYLPDRTIDGIVRQLDYTRQRGPSWLPRRHEMNRTFLAVGGIAAAVALVIVAGVMVLGLNANQSGVGGQPSASPTAMPSPTSAPSPSPSPTASPSPTSTPGAGLPEGPFDFEDSGMAMSVTIPAPGWTFHRQFTVLEKGREVANLPEAAILFWSFPAGTEFYVPGDPCRSKSTKPDNPATTVDEIAARLAAQASRDASEPEDVTVGGYAGKSITLHVPDDAGFDESFRECEGGEFVSYGTATDPMARRHQGPGQIDELWILDVNGAFVIIDAMYRPDTPAELVEEMRTIAESATFETP